MVANCYKVSIFIKNDKADFTPIREKEQHKMCRTLSSCIRPRVSYYHPVFGCVLALCFSGQDSMSDGWVRTLFSKNCFSVGSSGGNSKIPVRLVRDTVLLIIVTHYTVTG